MRAISSLDWEGCWDRAGGAAVTAKINTKGKANRMAKRIRSDSRKESNALTRGQQAGANGLFGGTATAKRPGALSFYSVYSMSKTPKTIIATGQSRPKRA